MFLEQGLDASWQQDKSFLHVLSPSMLENHATAAEASVGEGLGQERPLDGGACANGADGVWLGRETELALEVRAFWRETELALGRETESRGRETELALEVLACVRAPEA